IIKSVISAFVIHNGTLSEDDIINIVYSYSTFKLHRHDAQKFLLSNIDKVNESDDFSLLNMLN
ncbi:flagellar protein FliB, partial [Yersinia sp. 2542 StPb PI]